MSHARGSSAASMRFARGGAPLLGSLALLVACGGGADRAASPGTPAAGAPSAGAPTGDTRAAQGAPAAAPAPPAPGAPGRTVEVRMVGDGAGYRFEPARVTVRAGDTVRWTNVSGGPHNVAFWSDSVPPGAAAMLQERMPGGAAALSGPLLVAPGATYAIAFSGVPAGTYRYFCTPHLALGMKAEVEVRP